MGWAFFEAHETAVSRQLSDSLAGDVAWMAAIVQEDPRRPPGWRGWPPAPSAPSRCRWRSSRTAPLPRRRRPGLLPTFDAPLRAALDDKLEAPTWVDTTRYPAFVDIRVAVRGGVLRILAPRERAFSTRGQRLPAVADGATLLLTTVAIAFIRNQVRAIERLAAAADAFGRGAEARPTSSRTARARCARRRRPSWP